VIQDEQDNPVPGRVPFRFRVIIAYRRIFSRIVLPFIPFIVSYDCGWIDGWNACRNTPPDQREYMTREKMHKRYGHVPSVPSAGNLFKDDNVQ
jgi:hypothetical protein